MHHNISCKLISKMKMVNNLTGKPVRNKLTYLSIPGIHFQLN